MKHIALLLVVVMCLATPVFAGDKEHSGSMTGWICNEKCVKETAGKSTCDTSCTETSGDFVFIDDQGKVSKIANQDKAKPMAGKKVKMEGTMDKDTGMLSIQNMVEYGGG
ncbi:MAG: hypothetical protein ACE14M_13565 [Terriglobales bacterium]